MEAAFQHVRQWCDPLPVLFLQNNRGTAETKQHNLLMTSIIEKLLKQTDLFDVDQQNGLLVCELVPECVRLCIYVCVCVCVYCAFEM